MRSNERSSTSERELSQTAGRGRHVVGKEVDNTTIQNKAIKYPTEGSDLYIAAHTWPSYEEGQRKGEVASGVTRPDV